MLGVACLATVPAVAPVMAPRIRISPPPKSEGAQSSASDIVVGVATWYGREFHGLNTASGEIFDMFRFTAAHRVLPLGSYVRVTNLRNRRSVVVRINDRGPMRGSAIIDLSYAAAEMLGMAERGWAKVRLDLLDKPRGLEAALAGN